MAKLSFNIIGAGAMGHLWASFLSNQGWQTRLYARKTQAKRHFTIRSPLGDFVQELDYDILENWYDADVTIITVKAHQLEALCQQLTHFKIKPRQILLLMNGMGLVEIIAQYLPHSPTLHASTVHGVYLEKDKIIHTGNGITKLGNLSSDYTSEHFNSLVSQLNEVLPQVYWNNTHQQSMNLKLVINAIINPLTALLNQPNGCILIDGKLNHQAQDLLDELRPLLTRLLPELSMSTIKREVETVAYNTRKNISSMLQDIQNNRQTEIDYINGYLIKQASKYHLKLPIHQKTLNNIKQLEKYETHPISYKSQLD